MFATRWVGFKKESPQKSPVFPALFLFLFPTLPRASFDGNISERSIRSINPLLLYETLISCAQKARSGLLRSPLSAAVQQDLKRGSPIWWAALFSSFCTFFFFLSLSLSLSNCCAVFGGPCATLAAGEGSPSLCSAKSTRRFSGNQRGILFMCLWKNKIKQGAIFFWIVIIIVIFNAVLILLPVLFKFLEMQVFAVLSFFFSTSLFLLLV